MAVKGYLGDGLADRDGGAGKGAGLDLPVEFLGRGTGESVKFEAFGVGELRGKGCVGVRDALFLLVVEGPAEGEGAASSHWQL